MYSRLWKDRQESSSILACRDSVDSYCKYPHTKYQERMEYQTDIGYTAELLPVVLSIAKVTISMPSSSSTPRESQ